MIDFFKLYSFYYEEIKMKIQTRKYYYIDNGTYMNKLIKCNVEESQQIYWKEMLFRIHFIATSSILRNAEWVNGIVAGIETNNTMIFASSLRGLLEAVTDSFYSLESAPFGLALNYKKIRKAIEGKADRHCFADELEKVLIHFEFASKDKNSENKALSAMEYIREYDQCSNVDTKKLYTKLCNIVHPAAGSLKCFKKETEISQDISYSTTCFNDNTVIKEIWNENKTSVRLLVKMSIMLPVLCLKMLNEFDFIEVDASYINECRVNNLVDDEKMQEFRKMMELGDAYIK